VGFEPTETHKTSTVFETVPFVHSGILPAGRLAAGSSVSIPQESLKMKVLRADANFMVDAILFPDEADFAARPAWQVIEAARRLYLTGELTLPTNPPTHVYLRDGVVYFAERSSDGALQIRLMMEGVISREQMQRGTVIVNGIEHVGRMFDADPTIDRASVELCSEMFTDDVMVHVANEVVESYELALYRRHPSGLDRWYPHSLPVLARRIESPVAQPEITHEPVMPHELEIPHEPAQATVVLEPVAPQPEPEAEPVAEAEPEPEVAAPAEVRAEPINNLAAPPVTASVPVTLMPAPTAPPYVDRSAASTELDASAIADEVTEAIRRALAGSGSGR
jgi:hypothetical protein